MRPTVDDLASAVAVLYGTPHPRPDHALLKRMLDMAQPQMAGARPLSYAQLLAGCVVAGWRPDDRWLAEHHAATAKALRAADAADADVLLQLLSALSAPQLAPQTGSSTSYLNARNRLLLEVAQGLLRDPAVHTLTAQPDVLVASVRQIAVQGALPDGQWVGHLTNLLAQGLVPQLSASSLAYAAESLALFRAAPPASFVDALLTQAGAYGISSYDPVELGLLLGGVHGLQAGALSAEAQEVWDRAHATFLPHCLHALPTCTPAVKVMVAGSVVAFLLASPAGASPTLVDSCWLSGLLAALPQCRTAGALPPPALLLDLLRLGSRVLDGREDGGTAALGLVDPTRSSSSEEEGRARELLLTYVERSLTDLATAEAAQVPGRAATHLPTDWCSLVRAAQSAGIRPSTAVLQQYTHAVVRYVNGVVRCDAPAREDLSAALVALEEAVTSVLLPELPWVPAGSGGEQLSRVLEAPALLQACSPRHLALLCTYATQSGLGSQRMWDRVAVEVRTGSGALSAAGGGPTAAADGFAVCYALEVAGTGLGAHARMWLEGQLRQLDAGSSSNARHLQTAAPLQELHVLWVAHRLGCLSLVPPCVWAAVHAATDNQLRLLLPYQLAQLVELRAAAAAEGLQLPPAPEDFIERVFGALSAKPQASSLAGAAAARALVCLPAEELGGGRHKLLQTSLSLFNRGSSTGAVAFGSRVSGLSAADVAAWVGTVEKLQSVLGGPPTSTLSLAQLRGVVGALAVPAANPSASAKGAGGGAGAGALGLAETVTVSVGRAEHR